MNRVLARAIRRAGAIVDRSAVRVLERAMARSGPRRLPPDARERMIALAEHYRLAFSDDYFAAPAHPEVAATRLPPRCGAEATTDLAFPSSYRPLMASYASELDSYAANSIARARLYHAREPRPTVLCVHGWGGGAYWLEERSFVVPYWVRIGLDVALVQLPFHGDRAPARLNREGSLFPSAHLVRTNEAFGQAVHDLRALIAYVKARGAPSVGVMGMSLGGYTSALLASISDELAFAIPMIPAVTMSGLMWRHGAESPQRRRAERAGITRELLDDVFAIHSPLSRPPRLAHDRLMIVAGAGDRITPPEQAEALWDHWSRPELVWFPGGHLAQIGRGDAFRAIRRRLGELGVIPTPAARVPS